MFCKDCGKQLEDDSNFCTYCGAEVKLSTQKILKLKENPDGVHFKDDAISQSNPEIENNNQAKFIKRLKRKKIKIAQSKLLYSVMIIACIAILLDIMAYISATGDFEDPFRKKLIFNSHLEVRYLLIIYFLISLYMRFRAVYNYFSKIKETFDYFYFGQLMAIALTLSSNLPDKLLFFQIILLIGFAYLNKDHLGFTTNKTQKIFLFTIISCSAIYYNSAILRFINLYESAEIVDDILLFKALFLSITGFICLYALKLLSENNYRGFKFYFIGQGVEFALHTILIIQKSRSFTEMYEESVDASVKEYLLSILVIGFMTGLYYLYKRKFSLKSENIKLSFESIPSPSQRLPVDTND